MGPREESTGCVGAAPLPEVHAKVGRVLADEIDLLDPFTYQVARPRRPRMQSSGCGAGRASAGSHKMSMGGCTPPRF